ncbi:NADH dehydrogenase subunit (plasmid) [Halorarum halophilum]|uniref:NADH dehydrogenase subunit n=2 Tax=Halorarum halophilum TaxID=2743090 RepID=A0A7D5GHI5_9EURY|nr:NADH dehydrogenase subunit [Halobaculum halophilum]
MDDTVAFGEIDPATIADALQSAGVAGAGGAGFPSYVKWQSPEDVSYLLVNHQESEPNYYADKWLARNRAAEFASFFEALLNDVFDVIVVGTKERYRGVWTDELESALEPTVYEAADLPVDATTERGVVLVYTPNVYTYSEESVLLMVCAGVQIGDDLPTDHGWIVHNTESLYNALQAIRRETPVTRKFVHVDGELPRHRCLDVPIGTPATVLLEAAGLDSGEVGDDRVLADGGPGWCYEIHERPAAFGVRKRTNAVLVLDRDIATDGVQDGGYIDVLDAYDWEGGGHETEPTAIHPDMVRIPLLTNAAYEGFVRPSQPTVETGQRVLVGDVIAAPDPEGLSNAQHASIDGEVVDLTETHVVIERR